MREIPNTNEIQLFLHCRKCLEEKPEYISPSDYSDLEVGWTQCGIQVWCKRHDVNIIHIDFEGKRHPANLAARGTLH